MSAAVAPGIPPGMPIVAPSREPGGGSVAPRARAAADGVQLCLGQRRDDREHDHQREDSEHCLHVLTLRMAMRKGNQSAMFPPPTGDPQRRKLCELHAGDSRRRF